MPPPSKCKANILNLAATASFHIVTSSSLVIIHSFDSIYCELLTASVNKVQMNRKYEMEHGNTILHRQYRTLTIRSIARYFIDSAVENNSSYVII
jgi:hypothetical protein